jgi:hypothetical protein
VAARLILFEGAYYVINDTQGKAQEPLA